MRQQIWITLGLLAGLFAGTAALANDEIAERWWVVMVKNEPTFCGQTSAGTLLCLHADELPAKPGTSLRRAGTAPQDWSFLGRTTGAI